MRVFIDDSPTFRVRCCGLAPEVYLELELEVYRLRAARRFAVPGWLICPACSYMLLEVDFDVAYGLASPANNRS